MGANLLPFSFPKSTKIASKIDLKMHQIFDCFLHRFFLHFGSILGPKLGPCWPHFPPKWGGPVARRPSFCWVYVIFRFLGRPGPLLAPFGLDFGRFEPRFRRCFLLHVGGFWTRFAYQVLYNFGTFLIVIFTAPTSNLRGGLVGLGEEQRILVKVKNILTIHICRLTVCDAA